MGKFSNVSKVYVVLTGCERRLYMSRKPADAFCEKHNKWVDESIYPEQHNRAETMVFCRGDDDTNAASDLINAQRDLIASLESKLDGISKLFKT